MVENAGVEASFGTRNQNQLIDLMICYSIAICGQTLLIFKKLKTNNAHK